MNDPEGGSMEDVGSTTLERSLDAGACAPRSSALRGFVFRLGFAYWMLFCVYVFHTEVGSFRWIDKLAAPVWSALEVWVGKVLLGIDSDFPTTENGSGDKTADWIALLCIASLALIAALVWAVLDRRRAHDARLRALARVVVRYTLAFALLYFGIGKVLLVQFPAPSAGRLLQRFGDASPMGLVWTFMGASPAYQLFAGIAETVGAVLVLFRRTTTLGALVLGVVLVNVALLNYCYDVPLKLSSAHYLAMCVVLVLPDLGALASVLWSRRPVPLPAHVPVMQGRRWLRIARRVIKSSTIAYLLVSTLLQELEWRHLYTDDRWPSGYWQVTSFVRDGHDVPPVLTDTTRWGRVRFQAQGDKLWVRWRFLDDSYGPLYTVTIDEAERIMRLAPDTSDKLARPAGPAVLRYTQPDPAHLVLEGTVSGELVRVKLELFDGQRKLLVSRGFHWINEEPFSR
jgi:uncharacterized membrane protein YphA (DoxX/SURF4 family)